MQWEGGCSNIYITIFIMSLGLNRKLVKSGEKLAAHLLENRRSAGKLGSVREILTVERLLQSTGLYGDWLDAG